ncbi:substrate-binding domain-containing protein [Streptomyces sp. NPDC051917]|uniref:substrate-binding domain-containing protein n=1 Tax=Streptomyces sp. NPDC051917 TaxID=3154754 RepID=UPI00344F4400
MAIPHRERHIRCQLSGGCRSGRSCRSRRSPPEPVAYAANTDLPVHVRRVGCSDEGSRCEKGHHLPPLRRRDGLFATLGPISLTSVDQAGRHIGASAAKLLLERIADRSHPTAQVKLSPTLVARRTTAPPPA